MRKRNYVALPEPHIDNPLDLASMVGGNPQMEFQWKEVGGKRRLIGNPNRPMRKLHTLFGNYIRMGILAMGDDNYPLRRFPSASAFIKGANPLKNAQRHASSRFFYITDIGNAYPSVDLERLAGLIVYIWKYSLHRVDFSLPILGQRSSLPDELRSDALFPPVYTFLKFFCSGLYGNGLSVGGPLSPFLFNLFCEVYVDAGLRQVCKRYDIRYSRYADDCVFSRNKPIIGDIRRELREHITLGGFKVNHRKSKVLSRAMGTVFITKIGLRDSSTTGSGTQVATIVFPQKKRRRLHGMIGSYLANQMDWPEKVSGLIAEFLYYYKNVETPTLTDLKTFALCKEFEADWAKYRHR